MLISPIGLLEPIPKQDHRIIPGCSGNPYRFIHTKCPLSRSVSGLLGAAEGQIAFGAGGLLVVRCGIIWVRGGLQKTGELLGIA